MFPIESFSEIEGIADVHLLWIDLIGPHFEIGKVSLSKDGGKRSVHRVRAVRHFHAANPWNIETRIEGVPLLPEVDFAVGVKVHRRARIVITDIGQMAGDVAGGQIESTAERDRGMGKVAADTEAALDDFGGREIRATRAEAIFDVVVDPIANGGDALDAVRNLAELVPGEV